MFPLSVPTAFIITGMASMIESIFNNVTEEICTFCVSVKNRITCIAMFRKVALPEILRNSLLIGVLGLPSTGCNPT